MHSYPSVSKTEHSTNITLHYESSIGSDLAIIDITHPPPELQLHPSSLMFDGWFGVPFLDGDNINHVRIPHSSGLLQLYSYPPSVVRALSSLHVSLQRSICLHVFPFYTAAALAHSIVCDIVSPSSRLPNTPFLPISHCFIIRPAQTNSTWKSAYAADNNIAQIMSSILQSEPLSAPSLQKLNVSYKYGMCTTYFRC